jgi:hypothetical protein
MIDAEGRWQAGIGDPTAMGWATVCAYLAAAALSGRAAYSTVARASSHERITGQRTLTVFWSGTALVMVALAINKQLDLQSLLTQFGRDLARTQGWYAHRQKVQSAFVFLTALAAVAATACLAFMLRGVLRRVAGAVIGLGWLGCFVVIRAASFHHIDQLLGLGPIKPNWFFELGGIALVALSALRFSSRDAPTSI